MNGEVDSKEPAKSRTRRDAEGLPKGRERRAGEIRPTVREKNPKEEKTQEGSELAGT